MECWECDKPAKAACAFCGRFVCKEHAGKRPNILAMYLGAKETPKLIPVADAIWCGICDPQDPVPMPELF
ncbi:MAG: hypothetical protein DWQ07_16880 [Chloroflexi bacterium]|nr:MAG: hypothetical protein DWQ07_16880 [Chloroflexota bacterium]MBL1195423.1 hypothetical protein [Chloroflexota bacterium]NOH12706.1 hypothetical protein [Chloroflexota bacterium]